MKKEPRERRNRKELKGLAKCTKKKKRVAFEGRTVVTRYCFRIGKKECKEERQLPFHYDPIINEIDEALSPYAFT